MCKHFEPLCRMTQMAVVHWEEQRSIGITFNCFVYTWKWRSNGNVGPLRLITFTDIYQCFFWMLHGKISCFLKYHRCLKCLERFKQWHHTRFFKKARIYTVCSATQMICVTFNFAAFCILVYDFAKGFSKMEIYANASIRFQVRSKVGLFKTSIILL